MYAYFTIWRSVNPIQTDRASGACILVGRRLFERLAPYMTSQHNHAFRAAIGGSATAIDARFGGAKQEVKKLAMLH